jgi:uncharacterized protein involved in response to NO
MEQPCLDKVVNRTGTAPRRRSAPRAWQLLSSEPHRLMFFCGALQAILAVAWWTIDLAARQAGAYPAPAWAIPPMWAHAWLLLYGLFPFFMFGFLMTAGPNWLGAPKMTRPAFVPAGLAMAGGVALFYAGLMIERHVAAIGALIHAAGWAWGTAALIRVAARHWNPNARYALIIFTFFSVGMLGDALFGFALASERYVYIAAALHGAVWFFLLPIFVGVSTRMVPFFASRVLGPTVDYRPVWARPLLMGGALAHGVLQMRGADALLWIVDAPLGALVFYLVWRWGLGKSRDVRLLSVLHISLAMLGLALLLSTFLSAAVAAGALGRVGLAPLHLLVIGYFSAMVVGMVSRVSLGHSGRELRADTLTWRAYLAVIAAGVVRAGAELAPAAATGPLMLAAAALWLLAFGSWAWRYVPMYVTSRVDTR